MLLLLFKGGQGGGPTPAALTIDNRNVDGAISRNASVTGAASRTAAVTGKPSGNATVTGRPPD